MTNYLFLPFNLLVNEESFWLLLPFSLDYLRIYVDYGFTNLKLLMTQRTWFNPLGRGFFVAKELWKMCRT